MKVHSHFLIQLKANCRRLFERVALHTALCLPLSTCETYEQGHGRIEQRHVAVYDAAGAQIPACWSGIQRLIKVRRWGLRKGKPFDATAYYILSKPIDSAQIIGKAIRQHWGIENELHWLKDVNLREDAMTITHHQAAAGIALLNTVAMNVLRLAGLRPVKATFERIANNVNELHKLLARNEPT